MKDTIWKMAGGRIRAIAFHCKRCKTNQFEMITIEMAEYSEDNLQCYKAPDGWGEHKGGLLCPDCNRKYQQFMRGD